MSTHYYLYRNVILAYWYGYYLLRVCLPTNWLKLKRIVKYAQHEMTYGLIQMKQKMGYLTILSISRYNVTITPYWGFHCPAIYDYYFLQKGFRAHEWYWLTRENIIILDKNGALIIHYVGLCSNYMSTRASRKATGHFR